MIFILQETRNSNLFGKNRIQENVKCHTQHEESWLRWMYWTGKSQITLLSAYIPWKKLCFSKPLQKKWDAILRKWRQIYMKEDVWKKFSRKLACWHLATSLQINFFIDNFQGFQVNECLQMATSRSCKKRLKCFHRCLPVK